MIFSLYAPLATVELLLRLRVRVVAAPVLLTTTTTTTAMNNTGAASCKKPLRKDTPHNKLLSYNLYKWKVGTSAVRGAATGYTSRNAREIGIISLDRKHH